MNALHGNLSSVVQPSRMWTDEEDAVLLYHALVRGTKQWGALEKSGQLPLRDNKACCNRFIFLKKRFLSQFESSSKSARSSGESSAASCRVREGTAGARQQAGDSDEQDEGAADGASDEGAGNGRTGSRARAAVKEEPTEGSPRGGPPEEGNGRGEQKAGDEEAGKAPAPEREGDRAAGQQEGDRAAGHEGTFGGLPLDACRWLFLAAGPKKDWAAVVPAPPPVKIKEAAQGLQAHLSNLPPNFQTFASAYELAGLGAPVWPLGQQPAASGGVGWEGGELQLPHLAGAAGGLGGGLAGQLEQQRNRALGQLLLTDVLDRQQQQQRGAELYSSQHQRVLQQQHQQQLQRQQEEQLLLLQQQQLEQQQLEVLQKQQEIRALQLRRQALLLRQRSLQEWPSAGDAADPPLPLLLQPSEQQRLQQRLQLQRHLSGGRLQFDTGASVLAESYGDAGATRLTGAGAIGSAGVELSHGSGAASCTAGPAGGAAAAAKWSRHLHAGMRSDAGGEGHLWGQQQGAVQPPLLHPALPGSSPLPSHLDTQMPHGPTGRSFSEQMLPSTSAAAAAAAVGAAGAESRAALQQRQLQALLAQRRALLLQQKLAGAAEGCFLDEGRRQQLLVLSELAGGAAGTREEGEGDDVQAEPPGLREGGGGGGLGGGRGGRGWVGGAVEGGGGRGFGLQTEALPAAGGAAPEDGACSPELPGGGEGRGLASPEPTDAIRRWQMRFMPSANDAHPLACAPPQATDLAAGGHRGTAAESSAPSFSSTPLLPPLRSGPTAPLLSASDAHACWSLGSASALSSASLSTALGALAKPSPHPSGAPVRAQHHHRPAGLLPPQRLSELSRLQFSDPATASSCVRSQSHPAPGTALSAGRSTSVAVTTGSDGAARHLHATSGHHAVSTLLGKRTATSAQIGSVSGSVGPAGGGTPMGSKMVRLTPATSVSFTYGNQLRERLLAGQGAPSQAMSDAAAEMLRAGRTAMSGSMGATGGGGQVMVENADEGGWEIQQGGGRPRDSALQRIVHSMKEDATRRRLGAAAVEQGHGRQARAALGDQWQEAPLPLTNQDLSRYESMPAAGVGPMANQFLPPPPARTPKGFLSGRQAGVHGQGEGREQADLPGMMRSMLSASRAAEHSHFLDAAAVAAAAVAAAGAPAQPSSSRPTSGTPVARPLQGGAGPLPPPAAGRLVRVAAQEEPREPQETAPNGDGWSGSRGSARGSTGEVSRGGSAVGENRSSGAAGLLAEQAFGEEGAQAGGARGVRSRGGISEMHAAGGGQRAPSSRQGGEEPPVDAHGGKVPRVMSEAEVASGVLLPGSASAMMSAMECQLEMPHLVEELHEGRNRRDVAPGLEGELARWWSNPGGE